MIVKIMNKRILTGAVMVLLMLNVNCWDYNEIEEITLMNAVGFDYQQEEELMIYTNHMIRAAGITGGLGEGGQETGPVWIGKSTGKTVFESSRNLAARSSRAIFEAHNRIVVVGENMAREKTGELVDFIVRRKEQRLNSWLLVAREGTAGEVLTAETELEDTIPQEIEGILEAQLELSTAPRVQLRDFIISMIQQGKDAYAPALEVRKEIQPPAEEFQVPPRAEEQVQEYLIVQGTAVFSGDKLAGYLTIPETKGLLWVKGEAGRAVIIPQKPKGGQVTVFITRGRSSLEPEFKGDGLKMKVKIEVEGDIGSSTITEDISDPLVIEKLERQLAHDIKEEVLLALAKSQEYKSDFLDFGAAFRRKDPVKWAEIKENWRIKLSRVEVEVQVIANLRRTGLMGDPVM